MKVEQLFACHRVSEERKVPLAILSFQSNAMYWWTALERERRFHKDPPITYWNDLRGALRRRHIPSYYNRDLMDNLQRLQQKNMSVNEYKQKMELYKMKTSIRKEETTTISRFLSGLSLEIRDKSKIETPKRLERGKDVSTPHTCTRDVQCFKCLGRGHISSQCLNRRTLILRGKDEYNNQEDEPSGGEEKEKSEGAYPCEG